MKRPGYREAVEWIALNDDVHWLRDYESIMSVTACMVRDLYGVEQDKLVKDLRRVLKRVYPTHPVLQSGL